MSEDPEEEHRTAEFRRWLLKKKVWPRVIYVMQYYNYDAKLTGEEEFALLRERFRSARCPNIGRFVEIVQRAESESQVSVSYDFLISSRVTTFSAMRGIGQRRGPSGAAAWLRKIADDIDTLPAFGLQILDRVLGEAIPLLPKSSPDPDPHQMQ